MRLGFLLQHPRLFFLHPSACNRGRRITGIAEKCFGDSLEPWRIFVVKFAHVTVVRLNAHSLDTLEDGRRRRFIDDEFPTAFEVHGLSFVKEIDVESGDNIDEKEVDILQELIVCLERLDELRRGVHELLGEHHAADVLQQMAPFGEVRAVVRGPQKQNAVG